MAQQFSIPEEYEIPFRRIMPYLQASLQNDPQVMEALVLYLKFGGEKLARIVIDAFNVTRRIENAEMVKRLREEAMLRDLKEEDAEESEGEGESEGDEETDDEKEKEAS